MDEKALSKMLSAFFDNIFNSCHRKSYIIRMSRAIFTMLQKARLLREKIPWRKGSTLVSNLQAPSCAQAITVFLCMYLDPIRRKKITVEMDKKRLKSNKWDYLCKKRIQKLKNAKKEKIFFYFDIKKYYHFLCEMNKKLTGLSKMEKMIWQKRC